MEIDITVEAADLNYLSNQKPNESRVDWYVGITGQGKDKDDSLLRIKQHQNDSFPALDENSIWYKEVSSQKIAFIVEKKLGQKGFDIGEQQNDCEEPAIVYMFRKEK